MPDRIIRDELVESSRWVSLKDNADRLAYLGLLLKADAHGNFTADPWRLLRLWRDFGIGTEQAVAKTLAELVDHDLVRVVYLRDNLPRAADLAWLKGAGGLFGGKEIPSGKYAGEKVVFWGGVIVLGLVVSASGLVLDLLVPGLGQTRGQMQIAHMVHAVASVLMMAMFFGHIYMGTLGVQGAYQAMRTGYVDEAWAKDHHELCYDDVKAGRVPAQRSGSSAPPAPLTTGQA